MHYYNQASNPFTYVQANGMSVSGGKDYGSGIGFVADGGGVSGGGVSGGGVDFGSGIGHVPSNALGNLGAEANALQDALKQFQATTDMGLQTYDRVLVAQREFKRQEEARKIAKSDPQAAILYLEKTAPKQTQTTTPGKKTPGWLYPTLGVVAAATIGFIVIKVTKSRV